MLQSASVIHSLSIRFFRIRGRVKNFSTFFFLILLIIILVVAVQFSRATSDRKNDLFLIVDDLRPELGCYSATKNNSYLLY